MDPTVSLYVFEKSENFVLAVNQTTIPRKSGQSLVTISTALSRSLVSELQLTTGIRHETFLLIKLKGSEHGRHDHHSPEREINYCNSPESKLSAKTSSDESLFRNSS
jgi:hypothetical protein